MKFNKIIRGHNRQENTQEDLYRVLDAGFLCHVSFVFQGKAHSIPTAFGRDGDCIYLHGSTKNHMLIQLLKNDEVCLTVTHLDGVVLAQTLFNTSANYRSAVVYGTAELIDQDSEEFLHGLKVITDHIIKGRWDEVFLGTEAQLKATMLIKIPISSASVKIRAGGPQGDEEDYSDTWSGHIPMKLVAKEAVEDLKFNQHHSIPKSVSDFNTKYED
jgi:nitroimidazol reductase NimA-like FMN-containing flavoprotein (pyridoxamine 5'-phosphate oxidase superfamily)